MIWCKHTWFFQCFSVLKVDPCSVNWLQCDVVLALSHKVVLGVPKSRQEILHTVIHITNIFNNFKDKLISPPQPIKLNST